MGGGRQFLYPKWVWSPAGGWWANPTHWKRNTIIYGAFVAGAACWTWRISNEGTTTYTPKIVATAHSHDDDDGHH
jgi:hypothetical protein